MKPRQPELLPRPTEAELEILQVLWARDGCTVREVHEALHRDSQLVLHALGSQRASREELREIRSLLNRLEKDER